jgi:hypothetical protein
MSGIKDSAVDIEPWRLRIWRSVTSWRCSGVLPSVPHSAAEIDCSGFCSPTRSEIGAANPLSGAPRIHGELGKLGIEVSERRGPRGRGMVRDPEVDDSNSTRPVRVGTVKKSIETRAAGVFYHGGDLLW